MQLLSIILGLVGGLIASLAIEYFKVFHTNKKERLKIELQKSKVFFEQQFQAAQELSNFYYGLLPEPMDEYDDIDTAVSKSSIGGNEFYYFLEKFISKYSIFFSQKSLDTLYRVRNTTSHFRMRERRYAESSEAYQEWYGSSESIILLREIYKQLEKAHDQIRNEVRDQLA